MAMVMYKQLPRIVDYASAKKFWENARSWRSSEWEENTSQDVRYPYVETRHRDKRYWRKLRDDNKRLVAIGMLPDDPSVYFRYHDTDVVTYLETGEIVLHSWESLSTDVFANALTPNEIRPYFMCRLGPMVGCEAPDAKERIKGASESYWWRPGLNYYRIDDEVVFLQRGEDGCWRPSYGSTAVKVPYVAPRASRTLLKASGIYDFAQWIEMFLRLNPQWQISRSVGKLRRGDRRSQGFDRFSSVDDHHYCDMLSHPDQWELFADEENLRPARERAWGWGEIDYSVKTHARNILDRVRMALYRQHGLIQFNERPYLKGRAEIAQVEAQCFRYGCDP